MCTGSSILSEDRVDDRLSRPRGTEGVIPLMRRSRWRNQRWGNRNRASHEAPWMPQCRRSLPKQMSPCVIRVVSSRPRYVRLSSETHRESRDGGLAALGPGLCENSAVVLESRICISISEIKNAAMHARSVMRRQQRKQFLNKLRPGTSSNCLGQVLASRSACKSKSRKEMPGSSQRSERSSRRHDPILSDEPFGKGTITSQVRRSRSRHS